MAMHIQKEIISHSQIKKREGEWELRHNPVVRACAAFRKNSRLVPSTQWGYKQQPVSPAPGDPVPLASNGPCTHTHTY